MGFKTIKIGDKCTIKATNTSGTVTDIVYGKYIIDNDTESLYGANEIETIAHRPNGIKKTPIKKSTTRIDKVSDKQKLFNQVYSILRPKYLIQNPQCQIGLDGCSKKSTEIHHRYVRTGYWLICFKYVYATCNSCHRKVTDDSRMAINAGINISRQSDPQLEFTQQEIQLMERFQIQLP